MSDGKPPPRDEPTHWLKVGDENWGPTNMRKREQRPLSRPKLPPLPPRAGPHSAKPLSPTQIIAVILAFLPPFIVGFWLQKFSNSDAPWVFAVGFIGVCFLELLILVASVKIIGLFKPR
jgi:hypothetical protein